MSVSRHFPVSSAVESEQNLTSTSGSHDPKGPDTKIVRTLDFHIGDYEYAMVQALII